MPSNVIPNKTKSTGIPNTSGPSGAKAKALDAIFMYALFGSGVGVAAKPNQSRTECEQETLRRRGGDADRSRETISAFLLKKKLWIFAGFPND
jgi:hypothetical protein